MTKLVRFVKAFDYYHPETVMTVTDDFASLLVKNGVVEIVKSLDEPPADRMMRPHHIKVTSAQEIPESPEEDGGYNHEYQK